MKVHTQDFPWGRTHRISPSLAPTDVEVNVIRAGSILSDKTIIKISSLSFSGDIDDTESFIEALQEAVRIARSESTMF